MSRIIAIYNPLKALSDEIKKKTLIAENFLKNQTDQKTLISRCELLNGHALISIIYKEDEYKKYFIDSKKGIAVFIDGRPIIDEQEINAEHLVNEFINKGAEGMPKNIDGSWCILVVQEKTKSIFVFRDRVGHIPFYYSHISDHFFASSSPGSLIKSKLVNSNYNENIIARYASSNYRAVYGMKESFFKDISLIEPATFLNFSKVGQIHYSRYWNPNLNTNYLSNSSKEIEEIFLNCLIKMIKKYYKVNCDKDFGVTLSGGIDSGAIIGLLHKISQKKIKAISMTYKENTPFDETDLIQCSVEDHVSQWNEVKVDEKQLLNDLPKLYSRFDIPLCTVTAYCHEILFKNAASQGLTTLFTGAGGDALQGGTYPSYLYNLADLKLSNPAKYKYELNCWIKNHGTQQYIKNESIAQSFFENHIDFEHKGKLKSGEIFLFQNLLDNNFEKKVGNLGQPVVEFFGDYLRSYTMQELWFDDIAAGVEGEDVMCWSWGINIVSPFHDQKVIDLALHLPSHHKIKDGINKVLARKALKGIVPNEILNTVAKKGFNAPFDLWARSSLKEFVMDHLRSEKFKSRGIYNQNIFQKCLNDHMDNKANHMMLVWQALNLELWMRNWIDTEKK